ncbi:LytTR family transcriptional regulator [Pseudoalteromonas sp. SMS1]|uniref:LytTR family DNA-binding domain-containing protein n=1 Tax=Pseudoalteromonas sp. SMS1 TaxID=2908894 RepID=UPI001F162FD0|nr:LytTR family DNA-binding domain-containing protein [Pseudoalteromonas sp. SMS1]MCF2855872.1 LytTR family transcriptional regulator [Pseudoalteromonas sp. SMS1]
MQSIFNNLKRLEDYQLILLGWLVVIFTICLNCTVHSVFIAEESVDLLSSISWSLKEFGVWLVMTPALCYAFNTSRSRVNPLPHFVVFGLYAIGIALLINTSMDVFLEEIHWQESLFFNWHKHVIAFFAIATVWKMKLKMESESSASTCVQVELDNGAHRDLMVSDNTEKSHISCSSPEKKSDNLSFKNPNLEISQEDIHFVQACGNYLEIQTATTVHLVRLTLKELESMLDDVRFLRCHRSYLVNLNKVESLKNYRSGHGEVRLTSGEAVPVSKSKRSKMRACIE